MKLMMNRSLTNKIRFLMDGLPAGIRDNKYFMMPFYHACFKGKNIKEIMDWKIRCNTLTEDEYSEFYKNIKLGLIDRETDLNPESLNYIIGHLGTDKEQSILDVGCGKGYFLEQIKSRGYANIAGCDLFDGLEKTDIRYFKCNAQHIASQDKGFDIVTCSHVLEHTINLDKAIQELKRVARKKLIITVPCQKYFHYTLDLHLHFFPEKSVLEQRVGLKKFICEKKDGDLVYIGFLER